MINNTTRTLFFEQQEISFLNKKFVFLNNKKCVLFVPNKSEPIFEGNSNLFLFFYTCPFIQSGGSAASDTSSPPSSLSASEHASTAKSEPSMAPSPYAGQTVTSVTQVKRNTTNTLFIGRNESLNLQNSPHAD